jgi:hypothetical protein
MHCARTPLIMRLPRHTSCASICIYLSLLSGVRARTEERH